MKILVVEDDYRDQNVMNVILPEKYEITVAPSSEIAISLLMSYRFNAVLLNMNLRDRKGLEVLRTARRLRHPPCVIITSSRPTTGSVVEALRLGADDYLPKPFSSAKILSVFKRLLDRQAQPGTSFDDPSYGDSPGTGEDSVRETRPAFEAMVGTSEPMMLVRQFLARYGPSELSLLVTGESGTGKELAVRAAHRLSPFAAGPLVTVNCGAVPESLAESELFGSERGAFTDAVSRPGKFELAEGGTIFLDEIGEMSAAMQVKLLRVLENREFTRVGGSRSIPVNLRIISATNRDLRDAVRAGTFRQDLYYRLGILTIRIPPLRERKEDIPLLSEYFLRTDRIRRSVGGRQPALTPAACRKLMTHSWPGNIRELRNVLDRAALLSPSDKIGPEVITFH